MYYQFSLERKSIEPVDTIINWSKIGADVPRTEIPYTIIVPSGDNKFIYSPCVFGYSQTTLAGTRIEYSNWSCDISKLNLKEFSQSEFIELIRQYLAPKYHKYSNLVYTLIVWCFEPTEEVLEYPEIPSSEVALNVIQVASDILRIGKIETYISYP